MKKKILISGSNGFIGRHFFENLSKDYEVYRLNLRFNKKSFSEEVEKQLPMSKIDIYFHLSFDKRIISTNYRFINIDCLKIIYDILKKRYKDYQFFYISSLNVLLEKYYDKYTKTKLEAEKKIFSYKIDNYWYESVCMQGELQQIGYDILKNNNLTILK